MIDNFAPQAYPLEASYDGLPWALVIGWTDDADTLAVLVYLLEDDGSVWWPGERCRFRLADTRPPAVPTMRTVRPQRESLA